MNIEISFLMNECSSCSANLVSMKCLQVAPVAPFYLLEAYLATKVVSTKLNLKVAK